VRIPPRLSDDQARKAIAIVEKCMADLRAIGANDLAWKIRMLPEFIKLDDRVKGKWS
jgi:hypothetical protein